jgi:hypothetical protein
MTVPAELVMKLSYGKTCYKIGTPTADDLKTSSLSKKDRKQLQLDETKTFARRKLTIHARIGENEDSLSEADGGSLAFSD